MRRATILGTTLALAILLPGCAALDQMLPTDFWSGAAKPGRIVHLAVLPFAYRDGDHIVACDACPDRVVLDKTSEDASLLVTAFFYEALARHPRMQVLPYERVRELEGATMQETIARLAEAEQVEAVLVGAVLEMRDRIGDPRNPRQRGGAAIYAAAIELPNGRPVWKRVYDRTPRRSNRAMRQYERLVIGEESKAMTAAEVAETGVGRMVKTLAKSIN